MRIPLYVHSDMLTEPSIYPYIGYFDVFYYGDFATIRCSGQVALEQSSQDAYFVARTVEEQIHSILCSLKEHEDVDAFFDHFWRVLIETDLYPNEEVDIDDDIAMMVSWQELSTDDSETIGESTSSVCISGIGISQIFACVQENQVVWAPIVQQPHPFFRPLGKPDKTVGYLTIHNPILALGYGSLYAKSLSFSTIESQFQERKWNLKKEQQRLQKRLKAMI